MTKSSTLCLLAVLALGCATNYVGDVPEDDTGGDSTGANDGHSGGNPGDDGLSGNVLEDGGSDSGGDTGVEDCLPLDEVCGPEPEGIMGTMIDAYRTPDLGLEINGSITDVACTIASAEWNDEALRTVLELDCADEVHWQLWINLPDEALANLPVGRVLDLVYSWEDYDYQRNLSLLAGPDDPVFLVQNGRSVTPLVPSYGPFTVEVVTGACQPYCVDADQCLSTVIQSLEFGLGDETVEVWHATSGTIGQDRTYTLRVDTAADNPVVHPDADSCEYSHSMAQYWFVIAETTPVD